MRDSALAEVDQQLVEVGLLDAVGGKVSSTAQELYGFERTSSLPTAGVIVKGCLDDCDIREPPLIQDIHLDLVRKQLENKLLERQIELLDKSQEYRCSGFSRSASSLSIREIILVGMVRSEGR
jgi:hypothetical protein